MIPSTMLALTRAIEAAAERQMPLKPRVKVKAKGIPIGDYAAVVDAAGKQKIKPKRKAMGSAVEIAKRKRKKWRAAK